VAARCQQLALMLADELGSDVPVHEHGCLLSVSRAGRLSRPGAALLAAAVILIPGAPLLAIALNANVLATVLLPVSLVFLVMLANDTHLMGPRANKRPANATAITVIAFVGLCGAAYGIDSFLQATHLTGP
jgi:Mn2+/Fe2+ NRAMP family transporter